MHDNIDLQFVMAAAATVVATAKLSTAVETYMVLEVGRGEGFASFGQPKRLIASVNYGNHGMVVAVDAIVSEFTV